MKTPFPAETDLAKRLHLVFRLWVGNMGLGDHLPETWNAVAEAAKAMLLRDRSRSLAEIEVEIRALEPIAKDYDTERQSNDTCLAAGAHDALRWSLGLAENSISETVRPDATRTDSVRSDVEPQDVR